MIEGDGHKYLLISSATTQTTIYLSSVPGITADMYSQISEDNFFCDVNSGSYFAFDPGNSSYAGYGMSITEASVSYDPSNGKITFTPISFTVQGRDNTRNIQYASWNFYKPTDLYFIK